MSGSSTASTWDKRKLRIFSPDGIIDGDEREVDWPATIPFVKPANERGKKRHADRAEHNVPRLRIYRG